MASHQRPRNDKTADSGGFLSRGSRVRSPSSALRKAPETGLFAVVGAAAKAELQATATETQNYSVAASGVPGAGTWNVGFCVMNLFSPKLENNSVVNGWVQVTN